MKCITVYTNNYEIFSDLFETIVNTPLAENEERELEGITISESGEVPVDYIERMKNKPEVAVLKIKEPPTTILQHGDVFEILLQ